MNDVGEELAKEIESAACVDFFKWLERKDPKLFLDLLRKFYRDSINER